MWCSKRGATRHGTARHGRTNAKPDTDCPPSNELPNTTLSAIIHGTAAVKTCANSARPQALSETRVGLRTVGRHRAVDALTSFMCFHLQQLSTDGRMETS